VKPRITDEHRALAEAIINTFRPRLDVYAERLDDAEAVEKLNAWMRERGATKLFRLGDWKPAGGKGKRKPVTVDDVAEHVAGRRTLGFYPLHVDDVANSVSVDFDNHRGGKVITRDPREDLDALMAVCQRRGVRFIAAHSRGGAGYWLHILPPVGTPARLGRALVAALLREAGVKSVADGGTYDALFPKQDRLFVRDGDPTAQPGNLFCLPASARWMGADTPGTHLLGTAPTLDAQIKALTEY